MKHLSITLSLLAMSALCLFARNAGTEESFEVAVPGGLKFNEYNSDWLDSIPYLREHARWKEPWAYRALAECYRHGKGGVEKNLFTSMAYYKEAGLTSSDLFEESNHDPQDELCKLICFLKHSGGGIEAAIDSMALPLPKWALLMKEAYSLEPEPRKDYAESKLTPEASPEERLIGFMLLDNLGVDMDEILIGAGDAQKRNAKLMGDGFPVFYDLIGEKMWLDYYPGIESTKEILNCALEYMYRADQAGLLSKGNMTRIINYYEEHGQDAAIPFSDEDLARFYELCPKEYRDEFNSPAVVEEEVAAEEAYPADAIDY